MTATWYPCRVHQDRKARGYGLCNACICRLHSIRKRRETTTSRPEYFTPRQLHTVLRIGRPTAPIRNRWPDIDTWQRDARLQIAGRMTPPEPGPPAWHNRSAPAEPDPETYPPMAGLPSAADIISAEAQAIASSVSVDLRAEVEALLVDVQRRIRNASQ